MLLVYNYIYILPSVIRAKRCAVAGVVLRPLRTTMLFAPAHIGVADAPRYCEAITRIRGSHADMRVSGASLSANEAGMNSLACSATAYCLARHFFHSNILTTI